MALLCDKYRPTSLSKLDYNLDQAKHIKRMVSYICIILNDTFPKIILFSTDTK